MSARYIDVQKVNAGDTIEWCGRPVLVVKATRIPVPHDPRGRKRHSGVYLTIEVDGVSRRWAHYFGYEQVGLLASAREFIEPEEGTRT